MAELWITSRLLLTIFGGILCQLISASATLRVLNDVTWDTAFYTCHQHGQQLYSTSDITSLSDVTAGSYWIGAKVQYSSWMWTADNIPLFDYVGEVNESQSVEFYQIKYDNQASRCYYECQQHTNTASVMYVGLQGEKCYCFKWLSSFPGLFQRENRNICLGNFNENCGTENAISIYKIGLPSSWSLNVGGLCGYIEPTGLNVKAEENCTLQKGFICNCIGHYNSSSCYHHKNKHSWTSSNSFCPLTKLDSNNINIITTKWWAEYQYWIGLNRTKELVRSDNFEAFSIKINITQNGCVLLEKSSNGKTSFSLSNCSDVHSAICINNSNFQTSNIPSSETHKTSPVPSSSEITTSKGDKTSHKSSSSETSARETTPFTSVPVAHSFEITKSGGDKTKQTPTASEMSGRQTTHFTSVPGAAVTKAQILNKNEKDQTGVAVGVSVTLILLIAGVVVVTVWMKRSHKFCFETKRKSSNTRRITSVNQQNLSDYDEIKPGTDSHYEFETLTDVTMATKPKSSDYELATEVNAANVQINSNYNNIIDDDYNVLDESNAVKSSSDVYSQVNKMKKNKTSGPHIADNQNSNYNHTDSNVEGDYDTTESKPMYMSAHDKTYNHIRDVVEGDYDTTAPKTTFSHDETYNHIAAVTEDEYNIADMDLKKADYNSDDYSHLDSVRG